MNYKILPIKAFKDNYIWAIHDGVNVVIVDPGERTPVLQFLQEWRLNLVGILITHEHADHIGGVNELNAKFPNVQLLGCGYQKYNDFDSFKLPELNLTCQVINTPGHTENHVLFLVDSAHLFCGDVLFSFGCGRVFTSDFIAAFESLQKIKQLSLNALIYPAHEYTQANLNFTLQTDKGNTSYYQIISNEVQTRLVEDGISLPTTLANELKYNLFLRTGDVNVQNIISSKCGFQISDSFDCFVALRELRNNY